MVKLDIIPICEAHFQSRAVWREIKLHGGLNFENFKIQAFHFQKIKKNICIHGCNVYVRKKSGWNSLNCKLQKMFEF